MSQKPIVDYDKRRRRALMYFQILIYGYLITMCAVQGYMYFTRDW